MIDLFLQLEVFEFIVFTSDISLLSLLFFSLHAYRVIKEKDSRKPVIF